MKTLKFGILIVCISFGFFSGAGQLDPSWPQQLRDACLSSMPRSKVRVKDPNALCLCVADSHFTKAKKESDPTVAERQLRWVRELYETTDSARMQALVESPDNISDTDIDVMEKCLARVNRVRR